MSGSEKFPLATALHKSLDGLDSALQSGESHELLEQLTPTTSELLRFWFQDDFCSVRSLNFHEGQRRAILSIVYAHEVIAAATLHDLYKAVAPDALLADGLLTEVRNARHEHPKYAAKMATGTGKTWVLNALLTWQYLNSLQAPDDVRFTDNFLIVAPGLIVYDRLLDSFLGKERAGERNFETSDIFKTQDLFVPDDYLESVFGFVQTSVVTKSEIGRKVTSGGMVAITNWHLLAGVEDPDFVPDVEAPAAPLDPKAAVESFFPVSPGTSSGNELERLDRAYLKGGALESLIELPSLMVFNDEAHHIHEIKRGAEISEVEWQRSLTEIASHKGAKFVQVDFSATPFNEVGSGKKKNRHYFPHIVVDFDLNSAMQAGLVKSLALDKRKEIGALKDLDFRAERDESGRAVGLSEGQRVMLRAGLKKLSLLEKSFDDVDRSKHPKLMVICEDTSVTGFVVEFLKTAGFGGDDVLSIDSNRKGEMSRAEWAGTRELLFDIDRHPTPKVIVSVLMLREGFDVNNICVIVPLRSSRAQILLEQTIGRGLRLMWRGDEQIEDEKAETRERFRRRLEPTNFFDVLFIVEHPAFAEFYSELLSEGLAGEIGDDADQVDPSGDLESIEMRDDYEQFDFRVPFVVREAEEELSTPALDPLGLPMSHLDLAWLIGTLGKGDQFVSQEARTGTQFGDYRVEGGVMTATGYNDYLARMTRRIAEALHGGITKSAKTYSEMSRFPFLQVQLPQITSWLDRYIRDRLFNQQFDPLADENWRVLLLDDVALFIAGTFATALVESEHNEPTASAEVLYRRVSEVPRINIRTSNCVSVTKSIYPRLPVPRIAGGLEREFMEWAEEDSQVQAFVKIHEHKHSFLQRRYLKADGMPAMYSPDFLVRVEGSVYVVETKSQRDLANENVLRKQRASISWCEQINGLDGSQRDDCVWAYVLLGEGSVREWRRGNARVSELLEYARLRKKETPQQESMF